MHYRSVIRFNFWMENVWRDENKIICCLLEHFAIDYNRFERGRKSVFDEDRSECLKDVVIGKIIDINILAIDFTWFVGDEK